MIGKLLMLVYLDTNYVNKTEMKFEKSLLFGKQMYARLGIVSSVLHLTKTVWYIYWGSIFYLQNSS